MQYINGLWKEEGSHRFTSLNPATSELIWQGMAASEVEIHSAAIAASEAFIHWSIIPYTERYAYVHAFKTLVDLKKEELAELIAQETGKSLWDARSEAAAVSGKLGFADEAYNERTGRKSRSSPIGEAIITHRPHGVMAVYGPYNFPAHLPNGHIIPALLAGNTVIFKPSEQTPKVAEWMIRQWEAAGLPPGVLNLVQGERETGIALAREDIAGVLFTGSCATGKALHAQFGGRPEIILALEMGGNNPLIVCDVEDIKAAVYETMLSAFTSTGQRCTCARRLILPPWKNAPEFVKLLVESAKNVTIGAYDSDPVPFMGPLISLREAERLLQAQEMLESIGGQVLLRMRLLQEGLPFVTPGIIDMTGVKNVPDEEYFGPLLQIYRVGTPEQAVAKANDTAFGLSASILCDDPALYQSLSVHLRAGLINWNRQTTGASGAGPFGGIGISGNHRPAGYYSADYCAYPVASVEMQKLEIPGQLLPGITIG